RCSLSGAGPSRSNARHFRSLCIQQIYCLRKTQIFRHWPEFRKDITGTNIKSLKEEDLPRERQLHARQLPVLSAHIRLLHDKAAAPIQVTKNSPPEADILLQRPIDFRDALLRGVHKQCARHSRKHLLDARWRIVAGIRSEV